MQSVLHVERQVIGWFESPKPELFQPDNFPVWIVQDQQLGGEWYGFPAYDHPGMKLGKFNHLRGHADPNLLERQVFPADEKVRCAQGGSAWLGLDPQLVTHVRWQPHTSIPLPRSDTAAESVKTLV